MKLPIDSTLTIEPIAGKHLDELIELVNANRPYLHEWLSWLDCVKVPHEFQQFIVASEKRTTAGLEYSAVILENDRLVGRIGLYQLDRINRIASIGYWISEAAQGKGIISKACKAITTYGFEELGLNRIEIKCATGNYRSQAIPKRLGFQREGIIRQGELLNGRFIDLYLYSMLHADWKDQHIEP